MRTSFSCGSQVEGCQVEGYRRSILGPFLPSLNVAPARLREAMLRDKDVQPYHRVYTERAVRVLAARRICGLASRTWSDLSLYEASYTHHRLLLLSVHTKHTKSPTHFSRVHGGPWPSTVTLLSHRSPLGGRRTTPLVACGGCFGPREALAHLHPNLQAC